MVGEITERQLNEFLGQPKKAQRTGKPPLKNHRKQHASTTKEIFRLGLQIRGIVNKKNAQNVSAPCINKMYKQQTAPP